MNKKIVVLLVIVFTWENSCLSQINQQFDGYFLFRVGEKIIYYNYNEEEDGEFIPASLFTFNIKTREKETLLSNSIYFDCVKVNDSVISYTDGKTIFTYDILQKKKKVVHSNLDKKFIISKIASVNDVLYFFEINFSNNTCTFKQISAKGNKIIHTVEFLELEWCGVKSYVIDGKIIFNIQYLLYVYDTAEKQITKIFSQAADFSLYNNSVIYSYYYFPENSFSRMQLREYDLLSATEKEITDYPFKLFHHDLFSRLIDGKYQAYYKEGKELYSFSNSQWTKEKVNSFLIYQDEKIKVFLGEERTFLLQITQ